MADILAAALNFARRGIPVFPVSAKSKKPLTLHGFKDATTDEAQVRAWWTKRPKAMIGIPTGPRSKMWLFDVDIDPAEGIDGPKELVKLTTQARSTTRNSHHLNSAWWLAFLFPLERRQHQVQHVQDRPRSRCARRLHHCPPERARRWLRLLLVRERFRTGRGTAMVGRRSIAHVIAQESPAEIRTQEGAEIIAARQSLGAQGIGRRVRGCRRSTARHAQR